MKYVVSEIMWDDESLPGTVYVNVPNDIVYGEDSFNEISDYIDNELTDRYGESPGAFFFDPA